MALVKVNYVDGETIIGAANLNAIQDEIIDHAANKVPTSRKINNNALTSDVTLTAASVGAAPASHASTATTYGKGTSSNYGHLKVTDSLTDSTTAATGGIALSAKAGKELKDSIVAIESAEFPTPMQEYATVTGWRLNANDGLCSSNASYKLIKYQVDAGDSVKIVSDDRFQFQSAASVPSTGTSNRVGNTYGSGTFSMVAPSGATYLIVSTPTDGAGGAFKINNLPVNPCIREAKLIAHQGGSSYIKSSDRCFWYGITQGFKILEADLRRTSDNYIVVWHDTYYGTRVVTQSTLAQLQAENIGYGCSILTFTDLLKLSIDNNIALELDFTEFTVNATTALEVYNAIKQYNPDFDRVIFTALESKLQYFADIDPTLIFCASSIHSMSSLTNSLKTILKNSRYPMLSQNITNTSSDREDVRTWAKNNGVVLKAYTCDTTAKVYTAFNDGFQKAIVDDVAAETDIAQAIISTSNTTKMASWIYDARCELVDSNPFMNGIRLIDKNTININLSVRLLKNLTASQASIFYLPDFFRIASNVVVPGLVGDSFTALNEILPVYITSSRYISIKHNGLSSGKIITASMNVPINYFIKPFT